MLEISLGLENIRNYRRLSYTQWHALAEFVDNSTQSYYDHRDALDESYLQESERLQVRITLDRNARILRISDNAMGMGIDELRRAVRIGTPPPNPFGRSTYGLGMKTAGCWFGNVMTVRTKKLGEDAEHTITLDVEQIASGNADLRHTVRSSMSASEHYTIIEIAELNRMPHGMAIRKIKDFLSSMYRMDIREGILTLEWQGSQLNWVDNPLDRDHEGNEYRHRFDFEISGKAVRGWVGILATGSRAKAGFSILRAGRVLRGWPDSWRPESLYGQIQGSNDLVNQRLVGEVHLDTFEVAHTKDAILWLDDEEEQINKCLLEECGHLQRIARKPRRGSSSTVHDDVQIRAAGEAVRDELESAAMVDQLSVVEVPAREIVEAALAEPLHIVGQVEPDFVAQLEGGEQHLEIPVYLSRTLSLNDPYVTLDAATPNRVPIVINMRHPHLAVVHGSDGLVNYLRQCVYDALAQWKAERGQQETTPEMMRMLKDRLLRIPMELLASSTTATEG